MSKKLSTALIIFATTLTLLAGCSSVPAETAAKTIPWNKASENIGDTATVTGTVVTTKYASSSRGQPTFLNMGKPYPNKRRFSVVIWRENRDAFSLPPERRFKGKKIAVTGVIDEYQGVPEIEVETPEQIRILNR